MRAVRNLNLRRLIIPCHALSGTDTGTALLRRLAKLVLEVA
jgi:hypothetical protein